MNKIDVSPDLSDQEKQQGSSSSGHNKRVADEKRLRGVIHEIKLSITVKPKGLSSLKEMCLAIRRSVLTVADLGSSKARYFMQRNMDMNLMLILICICVYILIHVYTHTCISS
jgi:hypothetical protein